MYAHLFVLALFESNCTFLLFTKSAIIYKIYLPKSFHLFDPAPPLFHRESLPLLISFLCIHTFRISISSPVPHKNISFSRHPSIDFRFSQKKLDVYSIRYQECVKFNSNVKHVNITQKLWKFSGGPLSAKPHSLSMSTSSNILLSQCRHPSFSRLYLFCWFSQHPYFHYLTFQLIMSSFLRFFSIFLMISTKKVPKKL